MAMRDRRWRGEEKWRVRRKSPEWNAWIGLAPSHGTGIDSRVMDYAHASPITSSVSLWSAPLWLRRARSFFLHKYAAPLSTFPRDPRAAIAREAGEIDSKDGGRSIFNDDCGGRMWLKWPRMDVWFWWMELIRKTYDEIAIVIRNEICFRVYMEEKKKINK